MREYDFEDSVGYWICITSHIYQKRLDKELAPLGITFRQFQVLGWLVYEGGLSQAELAERMMIEAPTLVRILDRMQSQRLIQRTASKTDRRCKQLKIAAHAKPVWNKVVDCLNSVRHLATANMSAEEVTLLQQLLRRVQENLAPEQASLAENDPAIDPLSPLAARPTASSRRGKLQKVTT
jgi:MarR family transcriptional regulator for hemolysin